ncbi:hypothetical protein ABPG77_004152 [Micractinium sp. CCAP 211/92]
MAAEAFARRAALLGVVHFLVACLVPTLPPESVGYHRALVGAHVNSVTLAAMQMCVGLAAPLMGLSPALLSLLEVLLAVGTTAGGAGYIVGGVTGSMSPLTKILNAASPPGAPYVGTDTAMHVLLAYVAAPAILSALSLAAWGLAQGKGGSAKRKAA